MCCKLSDSERLTPGDKSVHYMLERPPPPPLCTVIIHITVMVFCVDHVEPWDSSNFFSSAPGNFLSPTRRCLRVKNVVTFWLAGWGQGTRFAKLIAGCPDKWEERLYSQVCFIHLGHFWQSQAAWFRTKTARCRIYCRNCSANIASHVVTPPSRESKATVGWANPWKWLLARVPSQQKGMC